MVAWLDYLMWHREYVYATNTSYKEDHNHRVGYSYKMGLAVTDSILYTEQLANATLIFLYYCGMLKVTMDKCTHAVHTPALHKQHRQIQ